MTLEEVMDQLTEISGHAYGVDASIRHDPFFSAIQDLRHRLQVAMDIAADQANWEAFEKWQAGTQLDHSLCPDDGDCLVEAQISHTTAF